MAGLKVFFTEGSLRCVFVDLILLLRMRLNVLRRVSSRWEKNESTLLPIIMLAMSGNFRNSLTRVPNPTAEPMIQGVSLPILGPAEDDAARRATWRVSVRGTERRAVKRAAVLNDIADVLFMGVTGGLWFDENGVSGR